ncbi:MAG: DUF1345 domain-containing protein [Proteobacteria bacterium]|nr:DUF1345 domain-containing protein [Pseudomonadota bacterium]
MRFLRGLAARPALQLALLGGVVAYILLSGTNVMGDPMHQTTRLLASWTVFVLMYLLMVWRLLSHSSPEEIRKRAPQYDAGSRVVLALAVLAGGAGIVAVIAEVQVSAKQGLGPVVLPVLSMILSWTFVHVMFALHYAHDYYNPFDGSADKTLDFHGCDTPVYSDFLYFSFVIGCACATADVNILSSSVRRLAAVHGVISFFFNATIVGLFVNIAAGLVAQ